MHNWEGSKGRVKYEPVWLSDTKGVELLLMSNER